MRNDEEPLVRGRTFNYSYNNCRLFCRYIVELKKSITVNFTVHILNILFKVNSCLLHTYQWNICRAHFFHSGCQVSAYTLVLWCCNNLLRGVGTKKKINRRLTLFLVSSFRLPKKEVQFFLTLIVSEAHRRHCRVHVRDILMCIYGRFR